MSKGKSDGGVAELVQAWELSAPHCLKLSNIRMPLRECLGVARAISSGRMKL